MIMSPTLGELQTFVWGSSMEIVKIHERLLSVGAKPLREGQAPTSKVRVDEFERTWRLKLPVDYREFLIACGAPLSFTNSVWYRSDTPNPWLDEGKGILSMLYGLDGGRYDLNKVRGTYQGRIADNLVVFADAEGGNKLCLSVEPTTPGEVFFWDHEGETGPDDRSNLYHLGESFGKFVCEQLLVVPDDPEAPDRAPVKEWYDPSLLRQFQQMKNEGKRRPKGQK